MLWFFSAVSGPADDQPASGDVSSEVAGTDDGGGSSIDDESQAESDDPGDRASEPASEPKNRKKTYLVVHVVDGDTLDLRNGRTVRLAGIDAPEVGQCGYKRARNTLAGLVLGKRVTLGASDEEQDQYGRLLKYVDVGKTDAGLRLIKSGLAIARYDSRDGYGYHHVSRGTSRQIGPARRSPARPSRFLSPASRSRARTVRPGTRHAFRRIRPISTARTSVTPCGCRAATHMGWTETATASPASGAELVRAGWR